MIEQAVIGYGEYPCALNGVPTRQNYLDAARQVKAGSLERVFVQSCKISDHDRLLDLWWGTLATGGLMCGRHVGNEHFKKSASYFAGYRGLNITFNRTNWFIYKPETPPTFVKGKIVLVGNGPSVLGRDLGSLVDSFDEVIRFNDYQLGVHDSDTGSKTTLWCCYGKNAQREKPNPCKRVLYLHGALASPNWYTPDEVWRIPVSFYNEVRQQIKKASTREGEAKDKLLPSAGLVCLKWLLERCFIPEVSLVGFDHFNRDQDQRHHYWRTGSYTDPVEHDGRAEKTLFDELKPRTSTL